MKIIYVFLFLIFQCVQLVYAQSDQVDSPIYIGQVLVESSSQQKMNDICKYYHYIRGYSENGYSIFTHDDGSKIYFKVDKNVNSLKIEVKILIRKKPKNLKKILSNLGFVKNGSSYYKGSEFTNGFTICNIESGSPTLLTFTKENGMMNNNGIHK